jgi:hypothetical protein
VYEHERRLQPEVRKKMQIRGCPVTEGMVLEATLLASTFVEPGWLFIDEAVELAVQLVLRPPPEDPKKMAA